MLKSAPFRRLKTLKDPVCGNVPASFRKAKSCQLSHPYNRLNLKKMRKREKKFADLQILRIFAPETASSELVRSEPTKKVRSMKFFSRQFEINQLQEIRRRSERAAQFTVLTGRRRIGKTSLVQKAYEDVPMLYFFVSRKSERELSREFTEEMTDKLKINPLGQPERFPEVFQFLMNYAKEHPVTLMIDEFQDFKRVNPAVFSDMQRIWDLNKQEAKINLVVCGSMNSMMHQLFRDDKEPLYGRQTEEIKLGPFPPSVLKEILSDSRPAYTKEDLLALYLFTGGVPKYVELLVDAEALTMEEMRSRVLAKNSFFLEEGKKMLIEEFGRDYDRYFEILGLMAQGHNTRGDIEGILHTEIGGYLTRMERDYELIFKNKPMLQKSDNKNVHYALRDNFLRFWLAFIYKYNYVIEAQAYAKLESIVAERYATYSGRVLELYFKEKMRESGQFTRIGSWGDRKGENEIDLITIDDTERSIVFYEIKRQAPDIDLKRLEEKAARFLTVNADFAKYDVQAKGLSMEDM